MKSVLDDFFGDAGKCANCGAECDPDAELCPACRAEAERKQREKANKKEAGEWLKQRHITPHKGGRTVKRTTDVTPATQKLLEALREAGISLGDLVEEAARQKYTELKME